MATISNGESGSSVRTKLNEIINKVEGVTSINNNIDVTGTVTADGLTVEGELKVERVGSDNTGIYWDRLGTQDAAIRIADNEHMNFDNNFDRPFNFRTGSVGSEVQRMQIAGQGDISFYEDTGTTAKFFWDASAESLGIGTSSPQSNTSIHIVGADGASGASTNVSANELLVDNNGNTGMTIGSSNTGTGYYAFADSDVALRGGLFYDHSSDDMGFRVASGTAMTIDSSGNLLVGKSSQDQAVEGFEYSGSSQYMYLTKGGGVTAYFDRLTSDGDIVEFRKAGTTVGSIGSVDGDLLVHSSAAGHKGLRFGNGYLAPTNNSGTIEDNTTDLGLSSHRFKDLYLSGGVYLGGTGAANLLDDYEEGTWTPTFSSGTATLSYRRYTKIGDVVHFWMEVQLTGTRGSEVFTISGLPYNANYFQACSGYAQNYTDEGSQGFVPFVRQNTSQIMINSFGDDIIGTKLGNGYLNISGTYRTTS